MGKRQNNNLLDTKSNYKHIRNEFWNEFEKYLKNEILQDSNIKTVIKGDGHFYLEITGYNKYVKEIAFKSICPPFQSEIKRLGIGFWVERSSELFKLRGNNYSNFKKMLKERVDENFDLRLVSPIGQQEDSDGYGWVSIDTKIDNFETKENWKVFFKWFKFANSALIKILEDIKNGYIDLNDLPKNDVISIKKDEKILNDKRVSLETEIIELLKTNKQMVLTGAPGTGKTFLAKKIAIELTKSEADKEKQKQNINFVQFHSSYDYTDFVEGIRPNKDGMFIRQDGTFKDFCKKAINAENEKFVFIIDEINRADIGKVFGELMYCLEPSYRGSEHSVETQYQNMIEKSENSKENDPFADGFYIPENVYIIGTMNDIDRSVESFDFALRRRFVWKEIEATPDLLDEMYKIKSLKDEHIFQIKERMEKVNRIIKNTEKSGLNKHFCLGGSYFYISDSKFDGLDLSESNKLWKDNWSYRIAPLLREYLRGNDESAIKEFIESCKKSYFDESDKKNALQEEE